MAAEREPTYHRSALTRTRLTSRRALVARGDDPTVHELAGVAALVWRALEWPASTSELAADLADGLDVDTSTVEADLRPLLARLTSMGLAEPRSP